MITAIAEALSKDLLDKALPVEGHEFHLAAAIKWLKRAQDKTPDDGVGYGYYLRGKPLSTFGLGWRSSYVETSGYIVETFYDIAQNYSDNDAAARAERIGRWLLTVQNKDGSFANANIGTQEGIVFDTGQVLFGLIRCYRETEDNAFKAAAGRAVTWLGKKLSEDGVWRTNTHLNVPHAYNARTAWALLEYCKIFPNQTIENIARKNLAWVLTQQVETGFFKNCTFKLDTAPFTHTIAYTLRGLFEGGICLNDTTMIEASYKSAKTLLDYVGEGGFIPGQISISGKADDRYSCLTGNCQMVIIWLKMGRYFNDQDMLSKAHLALRYVLGIHDIKTDNENIHGALKGSHPIWGAYTPLAYPNWAAKFLIDALILNNTKMAS